MKNRSLIHLTHLQYRANENELTQWRLPVRRNDVQEKLLQYFLLKF